LTSTSAGASTPAPTLSSSTPGTPASSPAIDPKAQPAVDAYLALDLALGRAQRNPPSLTASLPPGADFSRFAFDPLRTQLDTYLASLQKEGVAYRGTPPTPRVTVTSMSLTASPYPTVRLYDCPTVSTDWLPVNVKTGKPAPVPTTAHAPPFGTKIEMIRAADHWGARAVTPDGENTCTP
jgi:hypothetical protein